MANFAKAQLLKYGWSEGKGLGKHEDGIVEALKPKLKFDTTGVGHYSPEYHWWEFIYNKASNNLNIDTKSPNVRINVKDKDAVVIKSTKSELILDKMKKEHDLHYGNFIKISTLENGRITKDSHYMQNNFEESNETSQPFMLTDKDLLKACGGRTAHKGARHGLKLNGKLARIERQEQELLQKMSESKKSTDWIQVELKRKKKKKDDFEDMDLEKEINKDTLETGTKFSIVSNVASISTDDYTSVQSRKINRKAKRRLENLTQQLTTSLAISEDPSVQGKEQSKKIKENDFESSTKRKPKERRKKYCDTTDVNNIMNNSDNAKDVEEIESVIEPAMKRCKKDVILEPSVLNSKIEKKKKGKYSRKERKKMEKLSSSLMKLDLVKANDILLEKKRNCTMKCNNTFILY